MQNTLVNKVNFELIRYANCWEDADVLMEGLNVQEGDKILSIGSAGDNSFSLLSANPELVVAVDVNKVQLYLIALKKASFECLSYEELLAFLGFRESDTRTDTFLKMKPFMEQVVFDYWCEQLPLIQKGVITCGKFERYFQTFSQKVLPLIHSKKKVHQLFAPKNEASQTHFYQKKWNTWRWKALFKIFFSRFVMGKWGRDPEFLKEVEVPVSDYIFEKAAQELAHPKAQDNHILRYNLTASFGDLLPHYLRPENFEQIKSNLHKLHLVEGYAQEGIRQFGSFDRMNLSNIFEYMNPLIFQNTAKELLAALRKGGRIAYWNLMVPRQISQLFPEYMTHLNELSQQLMQRDKGFFYNQFIIEQAR